MSRADYVAKYPRCHALLETVEKFWMEDPRKPPPPLDSSLKKHTTLLNRLKASLLVGPTEALIKEIDGLTLSKYLEEIVAAVVEGATKGRGDPEIAVDVIVHLHTRLTPDFLPLLLPSLLAILSTSSLVSAGKDVDKDKEKEEKDRVTRQRPVLRMVAELALVAAWDGSVQKGVGEVMKIIKNMMSGDPQFSNMPLLSVFLKFFGRAYLGPHPAYGSKGGTSLGSEDEALPADVAEMVPTDIQAKMREMFNGYFDTASKTLIKGQTKLLEQDKRNHEAYIKSGEIFEDRQQAYEKMIKAVERLTLGVQGLADLLGLAPPVLPTAASLSKSGLQIVTTASSFAVRDDGPVAGGIWDDEEERAFYEDLVDLKQVVPSVLLGIKEKESTAAEINEIEKEKAKEEAQKQDEEDIRKQLDLLDLEGGKNGEQEEDKDIPLSRTASNDSDQSVHDVDETADPDATITANTVPVFDDDGLQSGPAARLTAIFAALPDANKEIIDKIAVEFAFLNSKAARNRLIKFIAAVPKQRTDLLPQYGRLVATLDQYMPDLGIGIIEVLDEEMRYLQKKKMVRELDSVRLKNVRFFGELAKFKVAKPYTILHVLKVFLDDFKFNVENIANLLETCGRFLLRYEGTAESAKSMVRRCFDVELMRRKQSTSHLDSREIVMLENAFYQCNPPERVAREVFELSPMQSFIQHLLHDVLMKKTLDKVLKLMRKLHWEDEETYQFILDSFTEVWEIKFGNIPYVAALVYDLQRYHPEFSVAVVDQVMEDIRIGMEENIFKFNQRRISTVKYLGELYMYRVVNASVIFDVLWSLISFGHAEGFPIPGRDSPIDAVHDFFRVRLICTLLDTCGACFDKGSQRRKLDHFLVVFQLYVVCKSELPMDVDFMLSDTLEALRPKQPHLKTWNEAAAALDELLAAQAQEEDESATEDGSEDGDRNVDVPEEEDEEPNQARIDHTDDDDDDEAVVLREPKHEERDLEAEADFDREFAKMLADTTDGRKGERKTAPPIFDSAVPLIRKKPGETIENGGNMQFMLLSKKGNKQQIRTMDIPADSAIAINSRSHQQQNRAEQEQLKRLVLQNERRQENSEMQAIEQHAKTRGIKFRFVPS